MDKSEEIINILKEKSAIIENELKQILPHVGSAKNKELEEYYNMLWDYPLRSGKKLRPALCLFGCELFGGNAKDAIATAAAIDLFSHGVLIHDDIEDGSELRRKKPCLHKIYGEEKAINAGDGTYAKMIEALSRNNALIGAERADKVLKEFVKQLNLTFEGQAIEIAWTMGGRWDVSEEEYLFMTECKTAHYTTSTPLILGAIIARASDKEIEILKKIGLKLGYAFQIQDDVLNLEGEVSQYGKEIGGDILEGKRTLILIHLLKHAEEKDKILEIMNKPRGEKTQEDAIYIIELAKKYGSIDYAKEKAINFAREGREILERELANAPNKEAFEKLKKIADFIATRAR